MHDGCSSSANWDATEVNRFADQPEDPSLAVRRVLLNYLLEIGKKKTTKSKGGMDLTEHRDRPRPVGICDPKCRIGAISFLNVQYMNRDLSLSAWVTSGEPMDSAEDAGARSGLELERFERRVQRVRTEVAFGRSPGPLGIGRGVGADLSLHSGFGTKRPPLVKWAAAHNDLSKQFPLWPIDPQSCRDSPGKTDDGYPAWIRL
ncbi:hypothetical protein DFH06DRAFT_1135631 [Mycena polygramma]|nr:hypothetical protein DFH06DRAFT_1135631 [Mycena polygramma]